MALPARTFLLSAAVVASSVGSGVVCLSMASLGRTFRLHASRPGAELNRPLRADLPSGVAHVIAPVAAAPKLIRVDISGPLEQRAGYHDPCSGWTDGNDAIAERLCAALEQGDVLLVGDTPGGAVAGVQQGIARVLAAKAQYGRRITGWADEQIGSLGMWWFLAVCDELFIPTMGQIGSIGARGGHLDVSQAMVKAGELLTYSVWPDAGKIAQAPELPLSPLGKARNDRDVAIAGEAFCAAVCGGPIGLRNKLDRDAIVSLSADMLTGEAAHVAGLCDGVSTLEEVTAYALSLAEMGPVKSAPEELARVARARGKGTMGTRAEEDEARARAGDDDPMPSSKKPGGDDAPESAAGREIPTKCATCTVENDKDAKFCKGCGASMSTAPEAAAASASLPRSSSRASVPAANFAEILGLPASASVPAQKLALLGWKGVVSKAASMTGRTDPDEIAGALVAVERDAANAPRYKRERDKLRTDIAESDRLALAHRLVAAGEARGRVFVDEVSKDGKRAAVKLSPMFAEMRIGTLRGEVEAREGRKEPVNPFEPDRAASEALAKDAHKLGGGATKEARIAAATKDPTVIKMHANEVHLGNSKLTLEAVAATWIETLDGGAR